MLGGTVYIITKFVMNGLGPQQGVFMEMTPMYYMINFLVQYHAVAFYAATLGILYLKLKEKEIR